MALARDVGTTLPPGMDMLDKPAGYDQDRLEEVLSIKEQANAKFKEGDYFSAKCLYSGGLELLERCCLHLERADETWEGLKNNMALCDLKRKEWTRVIDTTTEVLTRNPANTKALYRRGVARLGCGKLQEAQRDLQNVVQIEPQNLDARQKLAEVLKQGKQKKSADKDQAEKMRGFLRGERLDDTVAITEDGGVRKMHGNENAPLFSAWMKRAWLSPKSGVAAVVTAHVMMKTQDGKEVFSTRKPAGTTESRQMGQRTANPSKASTQPAEPVRWVLDDHWGLVFKAWNSAAKSLQMHELGKFEVAKYTMGPSVEAIIQRCLATYLADSPAQQEMYKDVPEDVRATALRRQALQILAFPEEFCSHPSCTDPNTTFLMEMELLDVREYLDIDRDGRRLLLVQKKGKARKEDVPVVTDLSTVRAHFRISKLLANSSLLDTRMGLSSSEGTVIMREDKTKDPLDFTIGEEEAAPEGDFVPPCIGACLMAPPEGVVEGMHFEVILRDGVPVSDMGKQLNLAYADNINEALPNTTGPVVVRIEVEKVEPPLAGPSSSGWKGVASLQQERRRAEELESMDEGKHKTKALKRWRRVIMWLEQVLEGRKWKLQGGEAAAGDSMYDLEWDDDDVDDGNDQPDDKDTHSGAQPQQDALLNGTSSKTCSGEEEQEEELLLKQLHSEELFEWATAHIALAQLLASDAMTGTAESSEAKLHSRKHARKAVQASEVGRLTKELEVRSRSVLAARLLEADESAEALEVLKVALALDPTNVLIKDQTALAMQKDHDKKSINMKDSLRILKQDLNECLEAGGDLLRLTDLLKEVDNLPLTWEAVSETAVGKEVGRCAKHSDSAVADLAKAIVAKFHKLAKEQRPLWVR